MIALLLAAAVAAPPDLAAVGIVMSARTEGRVALLRASGRTRVVAIGDLAFGGRVAAIEGDAVTVDFESGVVRLRLTSGQLPPAAAPAPIAAAPAPAEEGAVLDPRSPSRAMARVEVERRLGEESSRILAETTLVPVTDGGKVTGFTLARIPENSLLSDAGLRTGDVLTEVNGVAIDSLATLISLWPRLQGESALRAIVLRHGQPVALSVALR